ncbi:MAG TPA: glycosyltransferase family 4 protein [Gaiellaceae bacterium]|nr:glycosyltransferase family 4 protein [Gaiellaceae bacterium]
MRVAYYSPLPPSRSGIADYSALLIPELARRVELVVAQRPGGGAGLRLAALTTSLPGRVRRQPEADVALYHVGNDPAEHGWIVDALRRRPGVVVLHEFVLHHLVSGITLARGDLDAYAAALERETPDGRKLAQAVADGRIRPLWETRPQDFPLAGEILDHATGLVVHSRHVEERARAAGYDGPVWRIPMPAWPVPEIEPAPIEGSPLLGSFGHVNESKRIPQLLAAFARFHARHPEARLLLVGSWSARFPRLDPPPGVIRRDYVPEGELWRLLAATDAVVSLRWPTMGETSAAAIRALSLGKPLVVSDVGWFSELPDSVAAKVPVGEGEIEQLERALEVTSTSPEMGAAALELARTEHELDRVADRYAAALRAGTGLSLSRAVA